MRSTLTILGVCFAVIGGFTVLDLLLNLALAHRIAPVTIGYAVLNLLIAYAFLTKQRWLWWALVANWVGFVCIVSLTTTHGSYAPASAIGFVINSVVVFVAVYYRKTLTACNWYAAGAFAAAWVITMGYTIYTLL